MISYMTYWHIWCTCMYTHIIILHGVYLCIHQTQCYHCISTLCFQVPHHPIPHHPPCTVSGIIHVLLVRPYITHYHVCTRWVHVYLHVCVSCILVHDTACMCSLVHGMSINEPCVYACILKHVYIYNIIYCTCPYYMSCTCVGILT